MSHKSWMKTVPTENCDVLMTFAGQTCLMEELMKSFNTAYLTLLLGHEGKCPQNRQEVNRDII